MRSGGRNHSQLSLASLAATIVHLFREKCNKTLSKLLSTPKGPATSTPKSAMSTPKSPAATCIHNPVPNPDSEGSEDDMLKKPESIIKANKQFHRTKDAGRLAVIQYQSKKSNVITLQTATDSEVWCNVITVQYINVVKSQKYLQA